MRTREADILVSMMVVLCLPLSLAWGCKKRGQKSTSETELQTYGGREYRFTELPPYFVELGSTDGEGLSGFCSGSHIGDGYILTAAHCMENLVCDGEGAQDFGIRYISQDASGDLTAQILTLDEIKAIAVHKKYFFVLAAPGMATKGSYVGHDIALIKTVAKAQFPCAGKVRLPPKHLELQYGAEHVKGVLYQHGIGLEQMAQWGFAPPGSIPLEREPPAEGGDDVRSVPSESSAVTTPVPSQLVPRSYFGGAVRVREDRVATVLTDVEELRVLLVQGLQQLDVDRVVESEGDESALPCFQAAGSDMGTFSSPFLFSADNKIYQFDNSFVDLIKRLKQKETRVPEGESFAAFAADELQELLDRTAQWMNYDPATQRTLIVTHSGPWHALDRVKKACDGDFGGPLVAMATESQSELPVQVSVAVGSFSTKLESLLARRFGSTCAERLMSVSTFAHLDWIAGAKASMQAGHHSTAQLPGLKEPAALTPRQTMTEE